MDKILFNYGGWHEATGGLLTFHVFWGFLGFSFSFHLYLMRDVCFPLEFFYSIVALD